jgi:hypothetical protein
LSEVGQLLFIKRRSKESRVTLVQILQEEERDIPCHHVAEPPNMNTC